MMPSSDTPRCNVKDLYITHMQVSYLILSYKVVPEVDFIAVSS